MQTIPSPAALPRRLLLIKSAKYANQPGYYLHNGRWHAVKQDKPAPKGAPVAAHPHAAGKFMPIAHFTDAEWEKLKQPPENTNAGSFNGQLAKLKQMSDAGDVTGILASGFGTNTYGKKLAIIANKLLGLHGSEHQVVPGQKIGTHAAVTQATTAPTKDEALQAAVDHLKEDAQQGDLPAEEKAEDAALVQKLEAAQEQPAAPAGLAMPAFEEGKTTTGVVAYYEKVAQQILAMAAAGDTAGLEKMKADGLKPNSKGKVSNTFKGKTANSKMLLALHAQALSAADGKFPDAPAADQAAQAVSPEPVPAPAAQAAEASPPAAEPQAAPATQASAGGAKLAQIPWDSLKLPESNSNAKQHNGTVDKIKALAEAGDVDGLQALYDKKSGSKQTYIKKQALLAQTALAALKDEAPAQAQGANQAPAAAQLEDGPKDGDTKPGADGMLVFKDGHWHKQDEPQAAEPEAQAPAEQHPVDAVPMPSTAGFKSPSKIDELLHQLKEKVKAEGPAALKGVTKHMKATNKLITKLPMAGGGFYKISGYVGADESSHNAVYNYVEALKAAAGKPKKASQKPKADAAPAATPAQPAAAPGALPSMDNWVQTGGQGGSNPGGKFKDPSGQEWYCKFPADEDVAKSEVLAAQLYAAAGLAAQDAMLVTKDGKVGIASKWVSVSKASPAALAKAEGAQAGFAVDAWLANWDVVGMAYDNLQVGPDGKAYRIDAGGSLTYRAQGGKKAFGATVGEIDSMRDAKINAQSAAVFGSMTEADITASVAKVAAISDQTIRAIVEAHGPGDAAAKKQMADTLIARKADLLAKYPKAAKTKPAKPQFKVENLSLPPNFENWNGSGKGLSSHHFINESNQAAVNAVYDAAKQGDLDTIKQVQAPVFDKASGQVKAHVQLEQHPSQHVKAYWSDMVNEVDLQLNPPRLPEIGEIVAGQDLGEIAALLKPVPSGGAVAMVPKHQKVGDYILLGKAINVAPVVPKASDAVIGSDAWRKKASEHYHAASAESKSAFSLYVTTSGARALNTALRTGNLKTVVADKSVAKHVENFKGLLVEIPEGSTFVRRMGMKGYGQKPNEKAIKELQQFLMMAEPGTVMQEPGFTSSSWTGGNKILGNNDIEWEFVAGKGVKMFPAWLTANKGEGEGLLPPNQRYMIVSSKKDGKTVRVKAILLPTID